MPVADVGLMPIAQLQNGSSGFAVVTALVLDSERGCWIEPTTQLSASPDPERVVYFEKDAAGLHVRLPASSVSLVRASDVVAASYRERRYYLAASVSFS
jgi:hypothetical protein